jgi:hypothetical protein
LLVVLFGLVIDSLFVVFALRTLFIARKYGERVANTQGSQIAPTVFGMSLASIYLLSSILMICRLPALREHQSAFLERVTLLSGGISPLIPITAILLAYACVAWMQLRRLDWIATRRIDLELNPRINQELCLRTRAILKKTEDLYPVQPSIVILGIAASVLATYLLCDALLGFDGVGFYRWFLGWGFGMLLLTVMLICFQAWSIWDELRGLLEWLDTTILRETFEKLGNDGVVQIKIWDMTKQERSYTVLVATAQTLSKLLGRRANAAIAARRMVGVFERATRKRLQARSSWISKLNARLNVHMEEAVEATFSGGSDGNGISQIYLALRLVALIRYAILHIVTLISFVAYGYVLAVVSVMFYPFAGKKTIGELLTLTFVVLLIYVAIIMSQFQKNAMLSRLEGSAPGDVSYTQLATHLFAVGGLPLLAIVIAQFPSFGQFVFSLLRPVLGALH